MTAPQMECMPPRAIMMISLIEKKRSKEEGLMKFM